MTTPSARSPSLAASLGASLAASMVLATAFVACSAAPSFTVGPAATDGGEDARVTDGGPLPDGGPGSDSGPTTDGGPAVDAGPDLDSGIDSGPPVDAGPRVDPATPSRDALLADADCILSYQAPLANGALPAVTELQTDARCGGRSVRFYRPGNAASWRGFDLTQEQLFSNSPHFALKSVIPDADYSALPAVDLSLLASTDNISPPRAAWSLYFVARAVNPAADPGKEQPLLNIIGNDASNVSQNFAFSLFLKPNDAGLAISTVSNNNRTSIPFGAAGMPISVDGDPLLCGVRMDGSQIQFETRRKTAAGVVTTSVIFSGVNNDPKFRLPAMRAENVRLAGLVGGGRNLQGWLGEFTLLGRSLTNGEHTGMMVDLARVHGF